MRIRSAASEEAEQVLEGVWLQQGVGGERMNCQRYRLAPGAEIPSHSHAEEQMGVVISGVLTLIVDGERRDVLPGEFYRLAPEEPHGVENEGCEDVVGVDFFSPPRETPRWTE